MDPAVIDALRAAGIDTELERSMPAIGIVQDSDGQLVPLGDEVAIVAGEAAAAVRLRAIADLFTGDAMPPDFRDAPSGKYLGFFAMIERTAADFCSQRNVAVIDQEFERLYDHLRRRPDGSDGEPLFSYLQAAARLYMSLRDVSRAEFEGVVRRLAKSARTFSMGYASRNYAELALRPLLEAGR